MTVDGAASCRRRRGSVGAAAERGMARPVRALCTSTVAAGVARLLLRPTPSGKSASWAPLRSRGTAMRLALRRGRTRCGANRRLRTGRGPATVTSRTSAAARALERRCAARRSPSSSGRRACAGRRRRAPAVSGVGRGGSAALALTSFENEVRHIASSGQEIRPLAHVAPGRTCAVPLEAPPARSALTGREPASIPHVAASADPQRDRVVLSA